MLLAIGMRLGPYEIVAPLGSGGMGEVYRARDTRLARIVAVKLLTGPVDHNTRGRLLEEARAAAALNHPNICTIHEIADVDDRLFIVMEHVDGRVLSDLVVEGTPIDAAIRYGIQIADALAHAHERGVVHRDLKTANLMLTSESRVKVLDFGIARRVADALVETATGIPTSAVEVISGTLAYMAPEQLRGAVADRRSDIWALGVVLYELVAGRRPFAGETTFELSSAILRDALPPLPSRVPKPLRALVARCLEKDPAQRYQRAGEVRAALEIIAAGSAPGKSVSRPRTTRSSQATKARAVGASRIRAIAVLPLDNLSRDPEQEYFADGITEALIGAIARIEGLRVISRTSIMRYKGARKSVPDIARELHVDGVIAGSVRRVGDRVRISTHLIDAAADALVWTANYDRDLHDVLALETEIAKAVADQIALTLEPAFRERSAVSRRVDPDVYSLCLKGWHFWRQANEAGLRRSIECFEQAIARDATYAPAYAGLSHAHEWLGFLEIVEPREAYAHGYPAAQRAIELDATNPDAHVALASLKGWYEWDWAGADVEFKRALELGPNDGFVRLRYATYLGNSGRTTDSVKQIEIARDLDPLWAAPHQVLGYLTYALGRYDESLQHSRTALELDPNYGLAHAILGYVHLHVGRHQEALDHFKSAMSLGSGTSIFSGMYAYACAVAGRRDEAERILHELETRSGARPVSRGLLSLVHVALGNLDEALRWLTMAYEQHDTMLLYLPDFDWWDPIRDTDVFKDIVARMKFPGPVRQAPVSAPPAQVVPVQSAASTPVAAEKSIIVLPFANLSPDADDAYFSDGLTDELITDLSRVAGLRVAPGAASFRLKKADKNLAAIAREFNVRYIVEGRVRKAGQSIRITAQLVDVAEDRTMWADKYTGEFEDVFELQERVSRSIADALQLRLQPASRAPKPEAAEAYLKGRHFARQATSAGFQKALECFLRATELDPNYGPAFAALADVYVTLTTAWDALPALETMPKAQEAARRALELDANLPEAHVGRALVAMFYEWDRRTAEREFREALRLSPNYADAHKWYAALLIWLDARYDEALGHIQRAITLDPVDPWIQVQTVWVYAFSRDFTRAVEQARQVIAADPLYGYGHYALGCALIGVGQAEEAIPCFKRGIELDGRGAHHVALLGMAYALAGRREEALGCLTELDALDKAGRNVAAFKVYVYAGLRDADQVMQWLEVAVAQRTSSTIFLTANAFLDFVRQDPRFIALLQKMGLGYLTTRTWQPEWRPPAASPATHVAEKPRIASLAVLPLDNLSRDPDQEYFADGMTEALITELAQIAGLRVISRTSVMRFKRATKPAPDVARELGVDAIVTGSVLRSADDVRITSQLVHATSDTLVWARSYERRLVEVLSLQREIASAIASEIRATTGGPAPAGSPAPRSVDPEAYTDYLKGRHRWHRLTEPDVRRAMEHFQAALARDPVYAQAYAGLALCHIGLSWMGAVVPSQACPRAKTAAIRAIELDDSLWEPRIALGYVANTYDWDWTAAERELNAAVARQPGASDVHLFYSFYFTARGRFEEAEAALIRAHELDPLSALVMSNLGYAAFFARRYEKATDYCRQTLDLDPSHIGARWIAGIVLAGQERYAEAIAELDGARRVWTGVPILGWLGYACARAGQHDRARDLLATLAAMPPDRIARSYEIARIHVGLGDVDAALADLERACDARETEVAGHLGVDPSMDPLRSEERFKAVLRRVGL